MSPALNWSVERSSWPHSESSRFVQAGGLRWHVQVMGAGPPVLLLHGTGASAHSWRELAAHLALRFTVIAPDLPGQGFSQNASSEHLTLPGMAAAIGALIASLGLSPEAVIGHSAGAAIMIRCCLDGILQPKALISINGALLPFRGAAGYLFPPLAKLLFLNPLTPALISRRGGDAERVGRLIRSTGSTLDRAGVALYARLFSSSRHVAATLGMMANWDLHRFRRDLPELNLPLLLIASERDKAVSPTDAERVHQILPHADLVHLAGLGHLAHEENAPVVAKAIDDFLEARI